MAPGTKWLPRRRVIALLITGIALGMTVGWPIVGALRAIFWVEVTDSVGPRKKALFAVYQAAADAPCVGRSCPRPILRGVCETEFEDRRSALLGSDGDPRWTWEHIHLALMRWSAEDDQARQMIFVTQKLQSYPDIAIGALAACISGSVLSRFCADYSMRVVQKTKDEHSRELSTERQDVRNRLEASYCAILAKPGAPRLPTLDKP